MTGRCLWLLLLAIVTAVCTSASAYAGNPPDVGATLEQRLLLMRDVAHYKYVHREPIEDQLREERVLQRMSQRGEALGLTPASARTLGTAVILASKSIQSSWHREWQNTGPPKAALPDLASVTRPAIDTATDALLVAAACSRTGKQDHATQSASSARLRTLRVDDQAIDALQEALAGVSRSTPDLAHSALDHIRNRGWLRVGMPGDYAPFAFPSETAHAQLRGIDVELAKQLASSLKVQLQLVPTSWTALSSDLAEGDFDVAMGGVTRTLGRQQQGFFSTPYFVDGKSAIARCADAARFARLEQVDQSGVVVLVNPGGSNEQFVRDTIQRATIKVMPDNLRIFAALAGGEGDVMFTDRAEIRWQAQHNPKLCPVLDGKPLNKLDKAVFMPRDTALKLYIDLWLEQFSASGRLAAVTRQYLP